MTKKAILTGIIIVILAGGGVYWFLLRDKEPDFILKEVKRGEIVQTVSETGSIKTSDELSLGFENSGRIEKIYAEIGDNASAGRILAKLDTSQLEAELKANQAELDVVLAKKKNAEVSLKNAEKNLENIMLDAEENLRSAYEDSLNVLDKAYLKIYDSFILSSNLSRKYFNHNDQEGRNVTESKNIIRESMDSAKEFIDNAENGFNEGKIDQALSSLRTGLEKTRDALSKIRDMAETISYRDIVSAADKTSLDNQKSYVVSALYDVINAQQIITAAKINKKKSVDAAKASVVSLEDELSEDGVYQAQISQAKAAIEALKNKISKSVLTAPGRGQIIDIKKKEGEVVQPIDTVISFLPAEKFQIDVDIYEEDIVKVKVGQPVDISLTAFPDKIIKGRVVSINPAQKIIDGVVYYTVTISFLEEVDGVKPGMTADVTIIVAEKDNVLLAPKEAVESMDGKEDVRVYNNGKTEKREIKTGLEGEDFYEVVSGLKEGEMVVVGKKS